jgi:hypothetical protein
MTELEAMASGGTRIGLLALAVRWGASLGTLDSTALRLAVGLRLASLQTTIGLGMAIVTAAAVFAQQKPC